MTTALIALFLVGPVVLVPIWFGGVAPLGSPTGQRLLTVARRSAFPTGVVLAIAFVLPAGSVAGLAALPWLAMASIAALAAAFDAAAAFRDGRWRHPSPDHKPWVALPFLAFAAGNAVADRFGVQPFGFSPTIILLTAIHFTFAGFVLVLAGAAAQRVRTRPWVEATIVLLVIGIPVTAVGFFGVGIAAWLGALLVAMGGLGIGLAHVRVGAAAGGATRVARVLLVVAGGSLLVSMPLAAIYATGIWLDVAWLDVPAMARTHGALNVIGFAIPATVGWALVRRRARRNVAGPVDPIDVLGFNAEAFVAVPLIGLVVVVVSLASLPIPWVARTGLLVAGLLAVVWTVGAIAVVWRTYGADAADRWAWIAEVAGRPSRWRNVTTGFDDSTAALTARLGGDGGGIDVHDPARRPEAALRRARAAFPPDGPPMPLGSLDAALPPDSLDAVFLVMSAHEANGRGRDRLFAAAASALGADGRLVLVEHLREPATIAIFGPGAWHFASRDEWLAAATGAGLRIVQERRLGRWVRGFVFARAAA